MRTMTSTAEPTIDLSERADAARLAHDLLAAQADAGALVAELMERPDAWSQAQPVVAAVAATARRVAGEVDEGDAPTGGALWAHGSVPAVVWAREVGVTQRLLRRALRRVTEHGHADAATTVALDVAAREMRAHVRELAGVHWAVV